MKLIVAICTIAVCISANAARHVVVPQQPTAKVQVRQSAVRTPSVKYRVPKTAAGKVNLKSSGMSMRYSVPAKGGKSSAKFSYSNAKLSNTNSKLLTLLLALTNNSSSKDDDDDWNSNDNYYGYAVPNCCGME